MVAEKVVRQFEWKHLKLLGVKLHFEKRLEIRRKLLIDGFLRLENENLWNKYSKILEILDIILILKHCHYD